MLGAGLGARHDGPVPILALVAGLGIAALMLTSQGLLGLTGGPLGQVTATMLPHGSRVTLDLLMAAAMVGWFGFNVGLGGAAVGALLGAPEAVGALALGLPLLALSLAGLRRWNPLALATAAVAAVLAAVVAARLGAAALPVTPATGPAPALLASVASLVGYASVFSVRAPDFSAGLAGRPDLARCVALLVGATGATALAGVLLERGTGSADLVGALAGPDGLAIGNLLVAVAIVAATFTSVHSGGLALAGATGLSARPAGALVGVAGLVLALVRFDRFLLPWLALLAATMPPLIVPMALEGWRRRHGLPARWIPPWTWAPPALLGVALTALGVAVAPLVGLAAATLATGLWWILRAP